MKIWFRVRVGVKDRGGVKELGSELGGSAEG